MSLAVGSKCDGMGDVLSDLQERMSAIRIVTSLLEGNKEQREHNIEVLKKLQCENTEFRCQLDIANSKLDASEVTLENGKSMQGDMTNMYRHLCSIEKMMEAKGLKKQVHVEKPSTSDIAVADQGKCIMPVNTIRLFTAKDFVLIPKYLIGRISIEELNSAVVDFNARLMEKYTIIGKDIKKLSATQHKKLMKYKEEDWKTRNGKGTKFLIYDDLKETASFRMETKGQKFVMIFRNCGRVKEDRIPKMPVRYIVA